MTVAIINSEPESADIVLLGLNYDRTSSFRKGSDQAATLIKNLLDNQIEFYDRFSGLIPSDICNVAYLAPEGLNALSPEEMVFKTGNEYFRLLSEGRFIITIGGEHSVINGPIIAIRNSGVCNPSDVTIVQLDAHFDLRSDDSDYSLEPFGKFAHCSVMRRAHELGFKLLQVGIRAYSSEELEYARLHQDSIVFFEWGHNSASSSSEPFVAPLISEVLSTIKTEQVYISIDVDGFDPSVMPDTGTPVPGGFSWDYGVKLIMELFLKKIVIGADVVEVAPSNEYSITAYNAAQLVHNMIGQFAASKIRNATQVRQVRG